MIGVTFCCGRTENEDTVVGMQPVSTSTVATAERAFVVNVTATTKASKRSTKQSGTQLRVDMCF